MKIEIKSATTGEQLIQPGTKPDSKKFDPFTKISQTAFVHGMVDRNGAPEPFPIKISLDLGTKEKGFKAAYPVGFYEVDAQSFFVDRFDSLILGRLVLRPVAAVAKAA